MDYQEYCEEYFSEKELSNFIVSIVLKDRDDVSEKCMDKISHFVMVQHYAALMSFGFCYMGIKNDLVWFEWKNGQPEWEAGEKPYRIGCLVGEKKYTVLQYPDPKKEETMELEFESAAKAVLKILECVGCDFIQEGLADIPEPNEISSDNIEYINIDNDDDSFEKHERKCQSITDKTVSKLKRHIVKEKFDENKIKKSLSRVKKLLFELHCSYHTDYIQAVTVKDGSIRIRCFDRDFPNLKVDIYTNIEQDNDVFSIYIINNINGYKLPLTTTDGKTKFKTDDIERISDIVSECKYGDF